MTCNPCDKVPCPHCDRGCKVTGCTSCRADAISFAQTGRAMNLRPAPTYAQIHDLGSPAPVPVKVPGGQLGRCDRCGGRTYTLDGSPWCPRPFCRTAPEAA